MPYLRIRYRHDVKCETPNCSEFIVLEGHTSDVVYPDGSLVKLPAGDPDLRTAFELACPLGHTILLYAPRDLQVVKSSSLGDADYAPIVLRSSLY